MIAKQKYYELDQLHKYWTQELNIDNAHITHMLRDGELPCYVFLDDYRTTALIKNNEVYTPVARCTVNGAAVVGNQLIINLKSDDIRDWPRICNDPTKNIKYIKFNSELLRIVDWNKSNPHMTEEEIIHVFETKLLEKIGVEPAPPPAPIRLGQG